MIINNTPKGISLLIIQLLFLISLYPLQSQFTGYGNDQNYQSAFRLPLITDVPPIKDDMPEITKFSYIRLDSFARSCTSKEVIGHPLFCRLDTLKFLAKMNFAIKKYGPQLFRSYIRHTNEFDIPNETYKTFPANVFYGTERALIKRLGEFDERYLFFIYADYFFKAEVDSVIVGIDTTWNRHEEFVNASLKILENI